MSELRRYCYCCRTHHPADQVRPFATRSGQRWRCLKSIAALTSSAAERDAFGREQSQINRQEAREVAERTVLKRHQSPLF